MTSTTIRQRYFEDRSALIIVVLLLPLLFLPKINLWRISGQTAGVRFDDLWLGVAGVLLLWGRYALMLRISSLELALWSTVLFSLFSYFCNTLFLKLGLLPTVASASLFYCFRFAEYFLFFYLGWLAARFMRSQTLVGLFLGWNVLLMVLQKMQWVGIFTSGGYQATTTDRMLGVASFGAETGLLLNMLFAFLLTTSKPLLDVAYTCYSSLRKIIMLLYPHILLLLFLFLTILTGARIAIATTVIIFLFLRPTVPMHLKWRSHLLTFLVLTLGTFLLMYVLYYHSTIVRRSAGLLSWTNVDMLGVIWQSIPLDYDPIGREAVFNWGGDSSWWMRAHKWSFALKLYLVHPLCWLQGIGPGFAMAALDGGFLRWICEVGVVGTLLYGRFFYILSQISPEMKAMIIAFSLNMVFFDSYLSYKAMSLLFLLAGLLAWEKYDS